MLRRLVAGLLTLVLSGTGAFAQLLSAPHPANVSLAARMPSVHIHASEAHPCCHLSSASRLEIAMPLPPANMPCGKDHDCCVSPGPANIAEVASTSGQQRPDAYRHEVFPGHSDIRGTRPAAACFCTDSLLPYSAFSTVLRI